MMKKWLYRNNALDIVDQFCYLGVLLHYNCKFLITQTRGAEQGRKAMFSVRKSLSFLSLNTYNMHSLFDTYRRGSRILR
jgi:hypothetical protein